MKTQIRNYSFLLIGSILLMFLPEYFENGSIHFSFNRILLLAASVLVIILNIIQYKRKRPLFSRKYTKTVIITVFIIILTLTSPFVNKDMLFREWYIIASITSVMAILAYKNVKKIG
jgi:hypothetical membrane protein